MKRLKQSKRKHKPPPSEDSSDDEPLIKKVGNISRKPVAKMPTDSSSESDIERYLKPADQMDFNSTFFNPKKTAESSFEAIERDIFSGVNRLSDSESDFEETEMGSNLSKETASETQVVTEFNFEQLNDYSKKMEEAKRFVAQYKAKRAEAMVDVKDLLAIGESKLNLQSSEKMNEITGSINSSEYETQSDSENEDWEEVENLKTADKKETPKKDIQITIALPDQVKRKKGTDIMMVMKRRLNRIKKENQVFVHKVSLLCWIAHGNYVNHILNDENSLALSLSLLPSQHCYPSERTDLKYLEQILSWYRKSVKLVETDRDASVTLEDALQFQINKKEANNKKMFVYIFISILRSLGIHCRLVISLQPDPLHPHSSELCSLSTKREHNNSNKSKNKANTSSSNIKRSEKRSKNKMKESGKEPKNMKPKESADAPTKTSNELKKRKSISVKPKNEMQNVNSKKEIDKTTLDDSEGFVFKAEKNRRNEKIESNAESTEKVPIGSKISAKDSKKPNLGRIKLSVKKNSKSVKESKDSTSSMNTKVNQNKQKATTVSQECKEDDDSNKVPQLDGAVDADYTYVYKKNKYFLPHSIRIPENTNVTLKYTIGGDCCINIPQLDGPDDSDYDQPSTSKEKGKPNLKKLKKPDKNPCPIKNHPKRLKILKKCIELDSDDDFKPRSPLTKKNVQIQSPVVQSPKKKTAHSGTSPNLRNLQQKPFTPKGGDVRNDIMHLVKKSIAEENQRNVSKLVKNKRRMASDEDLEYMPPDVKRTHKDTDSDFKEKTKVKKRVLPKSMLNRSAQSSGGEGSKGKPEKKKGIDIWAEVYLESEEKWISIDVIQGQMHCIKELHSRATHPVSYILAWDNGNHIKDITKRYSPLWNTVTRKLRIDNAWWLESLKPYKGPSTRRDRAEDEDLAQQQLEQPLPKTISEYKNHPLYALQRHLLKFEAIYPHNAISLGFVRTEPVYSRECVHTLHSREIWVKHAKVVKPGEKPYKIVKARPKYDKLSNTVITDQPLEIFGNWQIEDYVPPTAENGVVPRNAYGNVELFKACMLPKGTVHLQLPGLNKVARKMNIDCAPAVVGFDFHSGGSHPTFDGYVVCEEHEDSIIAAWYIEQEEAEKRAAVKLEKRVYGNWRRLIKGLLIRERLKARYNFGVPPTKEKGRKKIRNNDAD